MIRFMVGCGLGNQREATRERARCDFPLKTVRGVAFILYAPASLTTVPPAPHLTAVSTVIDRDVNLTLHLSISDERGTGSICLPALADCGCCTGFPFGPALDHCVNTMAAGNCGFIFRTNGSPVRTDGWRRGGVNECARKRAEMDYKNGAG
jgi:hypothetical protein